MALVSFSCWCFLTRLMIDHSAQTKTIVFKVRASMISSAFAPMPSLPRVNSVINKMATATIGRVMTLRNNGYVGLFGELNRRESNTPIKWNTGQHNSASTNTINILNASNPRKDISSGNHPRMVSIIGG